MANYIHSIPGRLRVKIPVLRSRPDHVEALENLLGNLDGIDSVSINPLTANVLITYCPQTIHSNDIMKTLRREGLLGSEDVFSEDNRKVAISRTRQAVGKALFGWAVGRALEGTGLGFLAAFI